jgi:hypothetical protein
MVAAGEGVSRARLRLRRDLAAPAIILQRRQ